MKEITQLDKIVKEKMNRIEKNALKAMEVETANFVKDNFRKQGYQDNSIVPWKPRKTTDSKGRDLRYYKRRSRAGKLTQFGHKNKNRAILIGHDSGNKMRDSFRFFLQRQQIKVLAKDYAEFHNKGVGNLPKRKIIGKSRHLIKKIKNALKFT